MDCVAPSFDPRGRSFLIHRLGPLKADAGVIIRRFAEEKDVGIRRALILCLGEFADKDWKDNRSPRKLPGNMQRLYLTDDDAGLHAAAEWLLRKWGHDDWLSKTKYAWSRDADGREKRLSRNSAPR